MFSLIIIVLFLALGFVALEVQQRAKVSELIDKIQYAQWMIKRRDVMISELVKDKPFGNATIVVGGDHTHITGNSVPHDTQIIILPHVMGTVITNNYLEHRSMDLNEVCSCPSGDGSLRHPCLVHPPKPTTRYFIINYRYRNEFVLDGEGQIGISCDHYPNYNELKGRIETDHRAPCELIIRNIIEVEADDFKSFID